MKPGPFDEIFIAIILLFLLLLLQLLPFEDFAKGTLANPLLLLVQLLRVSVRLHRKKKEKEKKKKRKKEKNSDILETAGVNGEEEAEAKEEEEEVEEAEEAEEAGGGREKVCSSITILSDAVVGKRESK